MKKGEYENLDQEISFVQYETAIENLDVQNKTMVSKIKREFLLYITTTVPFLILFFITKNVYFLLGISICTGGLAFISLTKDFIKSIKDSLSLDKPSEYTDTSLEKKSSLRDIQWYYKKRLPEEKPKENTESQKYQAALAKQLATRKDANRKYEEALKRQLENGRNNEQIKYQLALEKQLKGHRKREREKYDEALKAQQEKKRDENQDENRIITKEEAISELFKEIKLHREIYNIPPIRIYQDEWYAFFDTMYSVLEAESCTHNFYRAIRYVVRRTLVKALVKEQSAITLEDILENLNYLKFMNFSEQCLEEVKSTISILTAGGKIISFKPKKN